MAVRTKDLGQSADKWVRRASVAAPDYENGVRGSGAAWEQGAKAGSENWKQGVTAAASRNAFDKGVTAAGASKWEQKSLEKGPARFAQGVAVSTGDYTKGFGPFLQAIQSATLPPRGPSGDPRNLQRVGTLNNILASLKRR